MKSFFYCKIVLFFIIITLSLNQKALTQEKVRIYGKVIDSKNFKITGISVLLLYKVDSSIVNFTETDKEGKYLFNIDNPNLYLLKVNSLGYRSQIIILKPKQTEYNFILEESQLQLKEVIVKNKQPVVKMSGDTTTYLADDFASPQDRTIGDVLKKIPGITVAENGQIKFNGQNVGKLYLDGDDLLESKYNLATRTLPNNIVNQIQVLENHQSIKALEGKVFSDAVDINLTFKDEAKLKLFGQADLGGGLPAIYEEEANLISLKNNYKAIHTFKANNSANALENDVLSLNQLQEIAKKGYQSINAQLTTGTGSSPPLDQNRYLFNHSSLLNSANLWKLKNEVQLKSKVYYNYDKQKQRYFNQTKILLPNEVINYQEQQNNQILPQNFYADLILFENKATYYLNNKLSFEYENRKEDASLLANNFQRVQNHQYQSKSFSNELDLIKSPKGKTIKQYYSFISYQSQPENLAIDSASYPSVFLTADVLKNINQDIQIPTFFTNNYLSVQKGKGGFNQSYKLGFLANLQEYNSTLSAIDKNNETLYPDSSDNNLSWKEYKLYLEPNYEWKKGNFRLIAKIPTKYQIIHSFDDIYSSKINDKRLLINQNISLRYNKEKGISSSIYYIKTASAGNILQSYSGLVLNDYRSYAQNNEILGTSKRFNTGAFLSYRNPVKIFFVNLTAYYQENVSNNIAYQVIDKNLSYSERILLDNTSSSLNFNTDVSKYLFNIRSSITLSYANQSALSNQFSNNQLYQFSNSSQSLSLRWNGRIGEKLRYDYDLSYQTYLSKPKQYSNSLNSFKMNNTRQKLVLEYDVKENLFIKTSFSILKNKNNYGLNSNYAFWDFALRYKLSKQRIDFSLDIRNLTNIKNFETATINQNIQNNISYPLQGRMIIFKTQFTF
ncbi:MAG: carboxypeptidase-like regulatory domain-containing protein [Oligoflexus sp.]|nr:carboxypeptidase-like regulatory domain-containing protein [Pseudopedobacter sp.]